MGESTAEVAGASRAAQAATIAEAFRLTAAGRRRLRHARDVGRVVVSRDYLDRTRAAFARLGAAALAEFDRTAAPDGLPVWELERLPS